MRIKPATTYDLQETGHGKLTGHISCNTISKLRNWKLIILQAKIPGGAIEADRIGHQTHGGVLRIYYTRRKDAGRQEKNIKKIEEELRSHKDTGRKNETDVKGGKNTQAYDVV